jgi:serine/threonine-protein kinase
MPEKNWEKVKDVFHEALLLQSSEREAFLDEVCAGNVDLQTEVQSLLGSLNQAKNFLEMPVISQSKKTK